MYRYHEITIKKKPEEYDNRLWDDDKLYDEVGDIWCSAESKAWDIVVEKVGEENANNRYLIKDETYPLLKSAINESEEASLEVKEFADKNFEYDAANYFYKTYVLYYMNIVKAITAASENFDNEIKVDESDNDIKIEIREFINYNNTSMFAERQMNRTEYDIYHLLKYGELLSEKYNKLKPAFGDTVSFKYIDGTNDSDNDCEHWYGGHATIINKSGEYNFYPENDECWDDECYDLGKDIIQKVPEKEWRVNSSDIILHSLYESEDEYAETVNGKDHADNSIYSEFCGDWFDDRGEHEDVKGYDPGTFELVIYLAKEKMKSSDIVRLSEELLKEYISQYDANKKHLNTTDYDTDTVLEDIAYEFWMLFMTDELEVLQVYGNAKTHELKYGYKKID